jgi:predicted DCC family thiol-disulfide oxidoreductase YuxK
LKSAHPNIILFDGVCNLCNGTVKFILRNDRKAVFKFAPLQSPIIQQLLKKHGLLNNTADTFVYFKEGVACIKSKAVLEVLKTLGWPWKAGYLFIIIPRPVRDFIYDLIARSRYRIFGKMDSCMVPLPEYKSRFIE